jgi:Rv2258c-like winged HTH domain
MSTTPTLDERVFGAAIGVLELFGIYLGDKLGLYDELRRADSYTPDERASACGIHPRYAREWLEQQAVAGVLTVDDPGKSAGARRYSLPAEHVGVVADPTNESYLAPFARLAVGIANVLDEVVAAYRTGEGVPYARYGADFRHGQGSINRPAFSTALVDSWVPAVSGAAAKLNEGGRAADVGCGLGWAAIAVAAAFPAAEVWGLDSDPASIEDARAPTPKPREPASASNAPTPLRSPATVPST